VLGAGVVVLPAVAGSETSPTIAALNSGGGVYGEHHEWSPASATIAPGGTVALKNEGGVPHGVRWVAAPATPVCSGVPVEASGTKWSGTCTFATPGTYTFYCTVHGAEMTGTITVNPNGTTSTQTGSQGTTGTGPYAAPGHESTGSAGGTPASPLAGSAFSAIKLASLQHGTSVHGSVAVSQAGSGARLAVDLLAKRASLARARHAPLASAGHLVRSSVHAGVVPFKVALNARAKHALGVRHRLALNVRVVLTPVHGLSVTVTRSVVLRS